MHEQYTQKHNTHAACRLVGNWTTSTRTSAVLCQHAESPFSALGTARMFFFPRLAGSTWQLPALLLPACKASIEEGRAHVWRCQPHNSHSKPDRVVAAHRAAQPKPKSRAKAEEPFDHNASLLPNPSSAVGCREHSLTSPLQAPSHSHQHTHHRAMLSQVTLLGCQPCARRPGSPSPFGCAWEPLLPLPALDTSTPHFHRHGGLAAADLLFPALHRQH